MAYKDHETRKREIIDATLDLAAEKGLQKTSTQAIADRVGIAQATIFRHFRNRNALFQAVVGSVAKAIFTAVTPVVTGGGPADLRLRRVLERQLRFISRHRGLPRLLFSERLHLEDPDLRRTVRGVLDRYTGLLADLIREGQAEGSFRQDIDPAEAARMIAAMMQGLIMRWSLFEFEFALEQQGDALWRMVAGALGAAPRGNG
jgi:TetR/AcrR family transcriptional regulator